jgi:hypothetical protein
MMHITAYAASSGTSTRATPEPRKILVTHESLVKLPSHAPPQIPEPVKNTLKSLSLTQERPELAFRAYILRYGVQLVAHAVLLHRVAELRAGKITPDTLMQSVQGKTPPACRSPEGKEVIGSLRALSKSFYVPPCAFQNPGTFKKEPDKAIVFFSLDLANLFFITSSGLTDFPSFDGMDTFTKGVKTLAHMKRKGTIERGLDLVTRGYDNVVTNYVKELTDTKRSGPLGAISLIRHYEDLIRFYADRSKALLTSP